MIRLVDWIYHDNIQAEILAYVGGDGQREGWSGEGFMLYGMRVQHVFQVKWRQQGHGKRYFVFECSSRDFNSSYILHLVPHDNPAFASLRAVGNDY